MRATLHDVCRKTGLSTATVSRVINNSPLVTPETRARVLKAVEALGYQPNHAARMLSRQRTDTLAVIFPEIASGFYTEVLRGIDEVAAEHNLHLTTAFARGQRDEQQLVHATLFENRADAVIVLAVNELQLPAELLKRAGKHNMPIVVIGQPVHADNAFSISMDNVTGAEAALAHLFDHGHRHVAILSGPQDNYDAQQRLLGCQRAVKKAGIAIAPDLVWAGRFTEESGRLMVRRWLESGRAVPQAIFACNDAMAVGALDMLQEHGLRVPDDVALIGFDDIDAARLLRMSTVHVPMRALGRAAAETAIQKISGGKPARRQVLATNLVTRRSCGCRSEATVETATTGDAA